MSMWKIYSEKNVLLGFSTRMCMENDSWSRVTINMFSFFSWRAAREKAKAKEQQKRIAKVI